MTRKRALPLMLSVAIGVLTGCSGDDSMTGPEVPPQAEAPPAAGAPANGSVVTPSQTAGGLSPQARTDSVVPDQYIIILSDLAPSASAAASELGRAHGLTVRRTYRNALRGFSAVVPAGRLQALQRHPLVTKVVPNTLLFALRRSLR